MKIKRMKFAALLVVALALMLCVTTLASSVPFADSVSLAVGAASYTNSRDYYTAKLISIDAYDLDPLYATITVYRCRGTYTNTLCLFTADNGVGSYSVPYTNAPMYIFRNDRLLISGAGTNTGTIQIIGDLMMP